ncbi:MAG: hypothetical protein U0872_13410 [Planctomycetaceae bacterium]
MSKLRLSLGLLTILLATMDSTQAAHRWGLKDGRPDIKSAGQLAFGPDGILFVGDAQGANLFAVDTGDGKSVAKKAAQQIDNLTAKLAEAVGQSPVAVNDLAVNPLSGNLYLSVSVGEEKKPAIVKIDDAGKLSVLKLESVPFLQATLPNPPEDKVTGEGPRARNNRQAAITDIAFIDGKVLVSGLTSDKSSSRIREFPFPFADRESGANIEIYHANHGKLEDNAAVRAFIPMNIDGEPSILAGFTCTPLVRFSLDSVESGKPVRGTTVAELGNRNMPLDMVAYEQNGEKFILMSNTARGVMKISTKDIGRKEGITEPVQGLAGQTYETISSLEGTVQFDRLNDDQIVVIIKNGDALTLKTVALP